VISKLALKAQKKRVAGDFVTCGHLREFVTQAKK